VCVFDKYLHSEVHACVSNRVEAFSYQLAFDFLFFYKTVQALYLQINKWGTHTQPFNGRWSGTTRVGWYQKKHSPTHTHPDHRTISDAVGQNYVKFDNI